jgi:nitrite reductase/ring-hydroxylating ferredoxin subunit
MLTREQNETLTRVGPGTPMGEVLRRYWLPACLTSEVAEPDGPPVRVPILGEQLVAFRDSAGKVGLVQEECPHRGASLFYGRNEECGLRCTYHGWKFDVTGQCTDQRSELHPFAHRIKITSYPVHESGGIVWAYLGPPETITPFRDFGTDELAPEHVTASKELIACNWVQSMDGDLDTVHISNLHQFNGIDDIPDDGTDRPGYPSNYMSMKFWRHDPKAVLDVQDEWYGFRYAGIRRTPNGFRDARVTAYIFPATAIIGFVPFSSRHIMLVPVSDGYTYRYTFATDAPSPALALGGPPFFTVPGYPFETLRQSGIIERKYTLDNDYLIDREAQKSESFSGIRDFRSQDLMVTESAGAIYDRTREHLGGGDAAVIRFHRQLLAAAKSLSEGKQPPALAGSGDFRGIRGAEKVLTSGEDWRILGTDDDPVVRGEVLASASGAGKGQS